MFSALFSGQEATVPKTHGRRVGQLSDHLLTEASAAAFRAELERQTDTFLAIEKTEKNILERLNHLLATPAHQDGAAQPAAVTSASSRQTVLINRFIAGHPHLTIQADGQIALKNLPPIGELERRQAGVDVLETDVDHLQTLIQDAEALQLALQEAAKTSPDLITRFRKDYIANVMDTEGNIIILPVEVVMPSWIAAKTVVIANLQDHLAELKELVEAANTLHEDLVEKATGVQEDLVARFRQDCVAGIMDAEGNIKLPAESITHDWITGTTKAITALQEEVLPILDSVTEKASDLQKKLTDITDPQLVASFRAGSVDTFMTAGGQVVLPEERSSGVEESKGDETVASHTKRVDKAWLTKRKQKLYALAEVVKTTLVETATLMTSLSKQAEDLKRLVKTLGLSETVKATPDLPDALTNERSAGTLKAYKDALITHEVYLLNQARASLKEAIAQLTAKLKSLTTSQGRKAFWSNLKGAALENPETAVERGLSGAANWLNETTIDFDDNVIVTAPGGVQRITLRSIAGNLDFDACIATAAKLVLVTTVITPSLKAALVVQAETAAQQGDSHVEFSSSHRRDAAEVADSLRASVKLKLAKITTRAVAEQLCRWFDISGKGLAAHVPRDGHTFRLAESAISNDVLRKINTAINKACEHIIHELPTDLKANLKALAAYLAIDEIVSLIQENAADITISTKKKGKQLELTIPASDKVDMAQQLAILNEAICAELETHRASKPDDRATEYKSTLTVHIGFPSASKSKATHHAGAGHEPAVPKAEVAPAAKTGAGGGSGGDSHHVDLRDRIRNACGAINEGKADIARCKAAILERPGEPRLSQLKEDLKRLQALQQTYHASLHFLLIRKIEDVKAKYEKQGGELAKIPKLCWLRNRLVHGCAGFAAEYVAQNPTEIHPHIHHHPPVEPLPATIGASGSTPAGATIDETLDLMAIADTLITQYPGKKAAKKIEQLEARVSERKESSVWRSQVDNSSLEDKKTALLLAVRCLQLQQHHWKGDVGNRKESDVDAEILNPGQMAAFLIHELLGPLKVSSVNPAHKAELRGVAETIPALIPVIEAIGRDRNRVAHDKGKGAGTISSRFIVSKPILQSLLDNMHNLEAVLMKLDIPGPDIQLLSRALQAEAEKQAALDKNTRLTTGIRPTPIFVGVFAGGGGSSGKKDRHHSGAAAAAAAYSGHTCSASTYPPPRFMHVGADSKGGRGISADSSMVPAGEPVDTHRGKTGKPLDAGAAAFRPTSSTDVVDKAQHAAAILAARRTQDPRGEFAMVYPGSVPEFVPGGASVGAPRAGAGGDVYGTAMPFQSAPELCYIENDQYGRPLYQDSQGYFYSQITEYDEYGRPFVSYQSLSEAGYDGEYGYY